MSSLQEKYSNSPRGFVPFPFEYGKIVEFEVSDLTNLGSGVGRVNIGDGEWVVMVKFALPSERIRAKIYKNHKNFSEADLVEVLSPSPDRVSPLCPLFGKCGGCQYQHLKYSAQLDWKRRQVSELMKRIGGIEAEILETAHTDKIYGYRSKLTPHYEKPKGPEMPIGFVMEGRRNTLVDVPNCPIASDAINSALPELRRKTREKSRFLKRGGTLLLRDCGGKVVTDNREFAREKIGGLEYEFCAGEFFQNNPFALPRLVEYVTDEASKGGAKFLADTYCGVGIFAIASARKFEKVAGIEVSELAIKCAKKNAEINGIKNCEFYSGKSENIFEEAAKRFDGKDTAVIIDPPRAGCDESFLRQLERFSPSRIVYVSCAPDTQARDLKFLSKYRVEKILPFDLFPHTRHIESVATLLPR